MPAITTDTWPFKVTRMDAEKGRTTFQWVKATVEREFNGQYGYGLKFEEDTPTVTSGTCRVSGTKPPTDLTRTLAKVSSKDRLSTYS